MEFDGISIFAHPTPQEVEWPDWEAMEATVRLDHFMGANEEFRLLRLAILATSTYETATFGW